MKVCLVGVVLVLSLLGALFANRNPPSAEATCPNPGPNRPDNNQYYFGGGFYRPQIMLGGVYAQIQVKYPWVEPTRDINFSSAWTMLLGPVIPGYFYPYAQTGWIEWRNSGRQNFYTFTNRYGAQSWVHHAGAAFPLNSYHYYTTLHNVNSPGSFTFYVDGQLKGTEYLDWQPTFEAELFGEINTAASQLGGGYNYPMYAQDIAVWYSGGWQRPTLNVSATNWGYHGVVRLGSGSGQLFAIWDKYCAD